MRIFADHCVHRDVVEAMRDAGHRVERALDAGHHKSSDEEIFNYARKTTQVLLTFDKDFGNIVRFEINKSHGVVIVYIENMAKKDVSEHAVRFFNQTNMKRLRGSLWLIKPNVITRWPKGLRTAK